MNVDGDRFSSLPDDLIHKILSLIDIKQAIETSALSSRWRYIWTSMPCLNFSKKDFHTLPKFSKFITHVLSRRNNQANVHSVNLAFHGNASQVLVKRILDYPLSHNVQQLNITCLRGKKIEFPLSLFSSRSLKHLTLTGHLILTPPTWELPALATLDLHYVTLYDGLFSNCANLKNLTLKDCKMVGGSDGFNIRHPGLASLTLEGGCKGFNLVTPQLKNLDITDSLGIHLFFAPDLCSLRYKGTLLELLEISADLLHLEKADICIKCSYEDNKYAHKIVCLLQQLHSVEFLTLNSEIIKFLSPSVELMSHQSFPFTNLKNLKIYPADVTLYEQAQPEVTMSTEVKNYLLNGSPGATFTMVYHEEVRAWMKLTSARKRMREMQVLLEQWKENGETNSVDMAIMAEQVEIDTKMKWHFWERMTDINEKFAKGYKNITSILREIEGILIKLPASHRAKLQVSFSSLCAEAETIMDVMVDHLKIQCNKKPRLYFHESATMSQPSS